MERFIGILGILIILGLCYLMSNNKKAINYKTVVTGLIIQFLLALFILKVPVGQFIFSKIAIFINKILEFATEGANFVFGPLTNSPEVLDKLFGADKSFMFALQLIPSLIFMMILINILYYYNIMQKVISFLGKIMNKVMDVSGAEALSNVASSFVGQVVAQITIKPYLPNLTRSEVLASMTGSLACISGALLAVYAGLGVNAEYMIAACVMAAPGALVVSKIIYPEIQTAQTKTDFKISTSKRRRTAVNVLDAISKGASEGMKVGLNVIAMLIALIALIALLDWFLGLFGNFMYSVCHLNLDVIGLDIQNLSIKMIFGKIFSVFALIMGVPLNEISSVGSLLGEKIVLNEAIAYADYVTMTLSPRASIISVFALCGFANFASVAILISGVGELAPNQRKNLARMGMRALIGGTFTSYISACMAGILL